MPGVSQAAREKGKGKGKFFSFFLLLLLPSSFSLSLSLSQNLTHHHHRHHQHHHHAATAARSGIEHEQIARTFESRARGTRALHGCWKRATGGGRRAAGDGQAQLRGSAYFPAQLLAVQCSAVQCSAVHSRLAGQCLPC